MYHFGYGSNLNIEFLRKYLPSAEFVQKAYLPNPTYESKNNQFRVTLWREKFSDHVLDTLGVSDRQRMGVNHVQEVGQITNAVYQEITTVARKTAARDLDDLVEKGVLQRHGEKRGTHYALGDGLSKTHKIKK